MAYLDTVENKVNTLRKERNRAAVDNMRESAIGVTLTAIVAFGLAVWLTVPLGGVLQTFIAAAFWAIWGGAGVLAGAAWLDHKDAKRRYEKEFGDV